MNLIPLLTALLELLKPNPDLSEIRKDRKRLRLERKKLRMSKRIIRQIKREFKKDGFSEEEKAILEELKEKRTKRKIELITGILLED